MASCSNSNVAALYNALPTVEAANESLTDHEALFERLVPLLAAYDFAYGVILVHAHTTLADGEVMVDEGARTSPVSDLNKPVYGDRWLSSGTPYEFRKDEVPAPPAELFDAFRRIVGDNSPLGIFYAKEFISSLQGKIGVERTIGRDNVIEWVDSTTTVDALGPYIETAWLPGKTEFPQFMCVVRCLVGQYTGRHMGHTVHE